MNQQRERLLCLIEEYEPDGLNILIREKDQVTWGNIKSAIKND